jgi:hypothetical protein
MSKKKNHSDGEAVDRLRCFLTEQLEAYYQNDQERYDHLEKHILDLERQL